MSGVEIDGAQGQGLGDAEPSSPQNHQQGPVAGACRPLVAGAKERPDVIGREHLAGSRSLRSPRIRLLAKESRFRPNSRLQRAVSMHLEDRCAKARLPRAESQKFLRSPLCARHPTLRRLVRSSATIRSGLQAALVIYVQPEL